MVARVPVHKTVLQCDREHTAKHNIDALAVRGRDGQIAKVLGELHSVEVFQRHATQVGQEEAPGDVRVVVNSDFLEVVGGVVGEVPVGQFVQGHFILSRGKGRIFAEDFCRFVQICVLFLIILILQMSSYYLA